MNCSGNLSEQCISIGENTYYVEEAQWDYVVMQKTIEGGAEEEY